MGKFLAPFIVSISLIFTPVFSQVRDIQDVCDQTPDMQLFGQLMRQYPEIYNLYAGNTDSTIYVPSDDAMRAHFRITGRIFRRKDPSTAQGNMQTERQLSWAYSRKVKRATDTLRSVRITADTETSPTGRNTVIVKVSPGSGPGNSKRQLQAPATRPSTNVTLYTGAGEKSNILFGDIACRQGVAHVVDAVFKLPISVSDTLAYTNRSAFLRSIGAAGPLEESYNTADQITIFAPTDEAFANQSILASGGGIEYHVVNNTALYTPYLKDGDVLSNAQGNLYVTVVNDTYYINCVRIVQTDAITYNGVIHAIERILTPLSTPPYCGGKVAPQSNSTGVLQYNGPSSGVRPANKVISLMTIIGTVSAVIALALSIF